MTRNIFVLLLLVSFLLSGCGGGGGASVSGGPSGGAPSSGSLDSGAGPTGKIELSIEWPGVSPTGKLIPQAAERIQVDVSGEGLSSSLVQSILKSQTPSNQVVLTFPSVPAGSKTVEVRAFDASGQLVAGRIVLTRVELGQTAQLSAPLGVSVLDGYYKPISFAMKKNDTLQWVNVGAQRHSITADNGLFDSGDLAPGESFSWRGTTPGSFGFHCTVHPAEKGTLKVEFPPPGVSSISPPHGIAAFSGAVPGSSFTIAGSDFGQVQLGSTVTLGGGVSATVQSWSDTQITCSIPQGAQSGDVTVQVAGQSGNTTAFPIAVPLAIGQNYPVGIIVLAGDVFWIENPPVVAGSIKKVPTTGGGFSTLAALNSGSAKYDYGVAPGRGLALNTNTPPDIVWIDNGGANYQFRKMKPDGSGLSNFAAFTLTSSESSGWLAADNNAVYASLRYSGNPTVLARATFAGVKNYGKIGGAIGPGTGVSMDGNFVLTGAPRSAGFDLVRADKTTSEFSASLIVNLPFDPPMTTLAVSSPASITHSVADKDFIYWVEKNDGSGNSAGSGKIRRASKVPLGSNTTDLITGLPRPTRLVLDKNFSSLEAAGRLYWLDDAGLHKLILSTGVVKDLWKPPAGVTGGDLFFAGGGGGAIPDAVFWTEKSSAGRVYKMFQ